MTHWISKETQGIYIELKCLVGGTNILIVSEHLTNWAVAASNAKANISNTYATVYSNVMLVPNWMV